MILTAWILFSISVLFVLRYAVAIVYITYVNSKISSNIISYNVDTGVKFTGLVSLVIGAICAGVIFG